MHGPMDVKLCELSIHPVPVKYDARPYGRQTVRVVNTSSAG